MEWNAKYADLNRCELSPADNIAARSGAATGRRSFLNACLTLGASRINPVLCATLSCAVENVGQSIGKLGRLLQLGNTVEDVGGAEAYFRWRRTLAACALNPWLRSWMEELGDDRPRGFEAILGMTHDNGDLTFGKLLDFHEWFDPVFDVSERQLTFDQWLNEFRPGDRDDFHMALPLFKLYQSTGEVMPRIRPTPDSWLDAMLKNTRGMLFWTTQWQELLRIINSTEQRDAKLLIQRYMLTRPNARVDLEQIGYVATGQNFMQIIEERSPSQRPMGAPDYIVGEWLHQHWASALP
jgi:hypothetical protein